MPTDKEIDAAVDLYIELLEKGAVREAKEAEEYCAGLIEKKRWEDEGL